MRVNKIKLAKYRKSDKHLRADSVEGLSVKFQEKEMTISIPTNVKSYCIFKAASCQSWQKVFLNSV